MVYFNSQFQIIAHHVESLESRNLKEMVRSSQEQRKNNTCMLTYLLGLIWMSQVLHSLGPLPREWCHMSRCALLSSPIHYHAEVEQRL